MPETNSDIDIGVNVKANLKGLEEAEKAIDKLKTNLKNFGTAFQLGKIMAQMSQLTNMYKAVGVQINTTAGTMRNSSKELLSVEQAARKVSDSMKNLAAQATASKALSGFMAEFKKGGSDADKFKKQLASVELVMTKVKSTTTGKIGFEIRDIDTGKIISAEVAMKRVQASTITLTERIKMLKQEFKTSQGIDNFKMQLQNVGVTMDQVKNKGAVSLQFRDIDTGQLVSATEAMRRVEAASVSVVSKIKEIKAQFAETVYIEKFKQDMLQIGIIVEEIRSKSGAISLRFTLNTGEVISARDAMMKLKSTTDAAKLAQDKLNASQKQMKAVMGGISSMARGMQNVVLGLGLSMLFLGMQIKRTSEAIARSVLETYQKIVEGGTFASRGMLALGGAFTFLKFVIGDAIAEALLPFIPIILDIVEAVADWVDENPELVAMLILGAVALGTFLFVAGQLITPLATLVGMIVVLGNPATWATIAGGLSALGGALALLANPEVFFPLLVIFAIVVIAIIAIIAAVVALKIAWDKNFEGFRDVIASVFQRIANFIAYWFTEVYKIWKSIFAENLPKIVNNFFAFFQNLWDGNFNEALANLGIFVINVIATWAKIYTGVIYIFGKMFTTLAGIYVDFSAWLLTVTEKLKIRIAGLFFALIAALIRGLAQFGGIFVDIFKEITINFGKGLETMYSKFISFVKNLADNWNRYAPRELQIKTGFLTDDIDLTSNIGSTFDSLKTTVIALGETLATGVTITKEMIALRDAEIDLAVETSSSMANDWLTKFETLLNETLGADVINPVIDELTAKITDEIRLLTDTTEKVSERALREELKSLGEQATIINTGYDTLLAQLRSGEITTAQYQQGINVIEYQINRILERQKGIEEIFKSGNVEKDYYGDTGIADMADSYLEAIASLKNFADTLQKNTNAVTDETGATIESADQVAAFAEGIGGLPMAYINALAKMFTGGDANAIAVAENTIALEQDGKVNVDATNMMMNLINTFKSMQDVPTTATTTHALGYIPLAGATNNQTVNVSVNVNGVAGTTGGSIVMTEAELEKMMEDYTANYMKTYLENFKQGMNSYGV